MATVSSDASFFVEAEEFKSLVSELVATLDVSTPTSASSEGDASTETTAEAEVADSKLTRCAEILEEYQEQAALLDGTMPSVVSPIMDAIRRTLAVKHQADMAAATDGVFPFSVYNNPRLHRVFKLMYLLCKTRGYKHIIRLLPHEVADLEPAVHLLSSQDRSEYDTWETRYVLLLWLSILVLVPFDLATADSMSELSRAPPGTEGADGLIDRIVRAGQAYLTDPGAVRDAAGVCLARLLTRPDMDAGHLRAFLGWCGDRLEEVSATMAASRGSLTAAVEVKATGVLRTLVECAKHGHRETLCEHLSLIFPRVVAFAAATSSGGGISGSTVLRQLTVKFAAYTGLTYMPPRVVAWRYSRGQRSLLDNLRAAGVEAAVTADDDGTTTTAATGAEKEGGLDDDDAASDASDDDDADVPEALEDIIDMLLTGLRDADTIVRWSAAKGVGRVTGRLPKDFADDVVAAVLDLLRPEEGDGAWHGGCLALAELARRGLLLPARLPEAIPHVLQALKYDVRRGASSVGTHVRDAACYVCWAFARAYAPAVMKPHVIGLARGMLCCAVWDREINCRRAASAAFQENVGRQGHDNFEHGIEILTLADYFSLGNRANAYLEVAPAIAKFDVYRTALWDHVQSVKLFHWDSAIRELAANAVARLVRIDPAYAIKVALPELVPKTLSPQLFERHGAAIAIANSLLELDAAGAMKDVPEDLIVAIRNIVPKLEQARGYRGRGGELVRGAMCRLIECMSLSKLPMSRRAGLRMLETVDDCLKHPHDTISRAAVAALHALTRHCFDSDGEPDTALLDRMPRSYATRLGKEENPAVRRGMALALGALPKSLIMPAPLHDVVMALVTATKVEKRVSRRDAETRRNATEALADVVKTVGLTYGGQEGFSVGEFRRVFDTLLARTKDYATDTRGDVGSWVRRAAIDALQTVTSFVLLFPVKVAEAAAKEADGDAASFTPSPHAERAAKFLESKPAEAAAPDAEPSARDHPASYDLPRSPLYDGSNAQRMVSALLRLCGEKLFVVRDHASNTASEMLHNVNGLYPLTGLPFHEELKAQLDPATPWVSASICFPRVVRLLELEPYVDDVIEGLVTSIGGLTESVVKESSAAILTWFSTQNKERHLANVARVGRSLLKLLTPKAKVVKKKAEGGAGTGAGAGAGATATAKSSAPTRPPPARLILPVFRTLNFLLSKDCFSSLTVEKSDFASDCVALTRRLGLASEDPRRLMAAGEVFLGLLSFGSPVLDDAMLGVLDLLCHAFPKVRKTTAERLYVRLMTLDDLYSEDAVDKALATLTSTPWAGSLTNCVKPRDSLYPLLKLEPPADRTGLEDPSGGGDDATAGAPSGPDEMESYGHLVKEAGY